MGHHSWSATQRNSIIVCRVQLGQATSQLCRRTGIDDARHRLWFSTGSKVSVGLSPSFPAGPQWPCAVWKWFSHLVGVCSQRMEALQQPGLLPRWSALHLTSRQNDRCMGLERAMQCSQSLYLHWAVSNTPSACSQAWSHGAVCAVHFQPIWSDRACRWHDVPQGATAIAGPWAWNSLPNTVCCSSSLLFSTVLWRLVCLHSVFMHDVFTDGVTLHFYITLH